MSTSCGGVAYGILCHVQNKMWCTSYSFVTTMVCEKVISARHCVDSIRPSRKSVCLDEYHWYVSGYHCLDHSFSYVP